MNNNIKYFDLQVNGYAGTDFNSYTLSNQQLEKACQKLQEDKVEGILATLITDNLTHLVNKTRNLARLIDNNSYIKSIIKGIHVEGPFLNPEKGFRGAHPEEHIIPANLEKVKTIVDAGMGMLKLITLAPEFDKDFIVTKYLSENNIIVSAGHSDASIDILNGAIENGLKMFTHLGNGSPNLFSRHDNIVQRVLSLSDKLFISFIADGIHIPKFALKNYLKLIGSDRSIIVTDAMAAASAPPGTYTVSHISVQVGSDKIVRELGKDNLAGSAITMDQSREFLEHNVGLANADLKKILSKNALQLIGIT